MKDFKIMIPKKLHMIWIGDESKCPHEWIQTWKDNHPDWEFKLWGNKEYDEYPWKTKKQMQQHYDAGQISGVANLMRYEILFEHGGFYADADSVSLKPLDDFLLQAELFAAYENEALEPGLIGNTYMGSQPGNPILKDLIETIASTRNITRIWTWKPPFYKFRSSPNTSGPRFLTRAINRQRQYATIWPSILFFPQHHLDESSREQNISYADHFWACENKLF